MIQTLTHEGLNWIDLERPKKEEIESLSRKYQMHPLNVEDCLSKRQLPKIDDHGDHIFVLLHFPVNNARNHGIMSSQVCFFLGQDYVVSVHEPELEGIRVVSKACAEDPIRKASLMKSSAHLFYQILDVLTDGLFPFLQEMEESLESVSEKVFDEKRSVAVELSVQRHAIVNFRRIIYPLRTLASDIAVKAQRFAREEDLSQYYGDAKDHIEKAWETIEGARETIEIYKDTDHILSTEVTNKVLSVLTIVFTLTIPASVVGTLYGMNIPMPGALSPGPPQFLGIYTSFWFVSAACIVPALSMFLYFRRRGWM